MNLQDVPHFPQPIPLIAKELAAALKKSVWYVSAMRAAGYQFAFGTMTTLQHALDWLAANPHWRSTEYAAQTHKRSRPRPGDADKPDGRSR